MTTGRTLFAGLSGGIAMYLWASVAHVASPLSTIGISQISANEPAVLDAMHSSLGNAPGFYIFPSLGWKPGDAGNQRETMKNYDSKLQTNPSGILIYHPPGAKSLTPGQLISEFVFELLEALLAVWLLAQTRITTVASRIGFVAVVGLLASLPTNLSYWNWYGFPASYTAVYMLMQIIGFCIAGTVAAMILRRQTFSAVQDRATASVLAR